MAEDYKLSLLLDFYGGMLTETQREMFEFYYNDDLSLSEIAENEGITRQGVRDSVKRAESQLTDMENRLGLVGRFYKMSGDFKKIHEAAAKIKDCNGHNVYARDIEENADRILAVTEEYCE